MQEKTFASTRARHGVICMAGLFCTVSFLFVALMASAQTQSAGQHGIAASHAVVNFSDLARQELLHPPEKLEGIEVENNPMPPTPLPVPPDAIIKVENPALNRSSGSVPGVAPQPFSPPMAQSFLAVADNNTFIPPDTNGAVGPNHLMVTVNGTVKIQNRSGAQVSSVTLHTFWASASLCSNQCEFDPKILYDPFGQRWIFTASANASSANSEVLIGVSQTNDPTGSWNLYMLRADNTGANWADFPSMGFNKDWIVVTFNMFPVSGGSFTGGNLYVFNKANLYAGGAGNFTLLTRPGDGFTLAPAVTYDNSLATMYLLQNYNGNSSGSGYLRLLTITGTVGSETLNIGPFISTPNPWSSSGTSGGFAPQSGSANLIDTDDSRITNLVYRNGFLWTAHTIFLPAVGPTRSSAQWWQLAPDGTIQQRGRIDDGTGALFRAYPSIAVNKNNDVLIGYSLYSSSIFASAAYSFRANTDPVNTVQSENILKAGLASYFKTYSGTSNRWGDYSYSQVDPTNDTDLWTIQEYADTPSNLWATWWGKLSVVTLPPTISKAFNALTIPLNGTATLTFTITNPNTSTTLHGVGFSDMLPSTTGTLVVATVPNVSNTCGGTVTATAGTNTISLSGGIVNQNASCTLAVDVKGTAAGDANNTTGAITSTEGGTGATSNTTTLKVVAPPTISKAFGAANIVLNGTTSLTFTITNPAANTTPENGVAFTDTLPTGLQVASPNGLTNSCSGTATAVAGSVSISLAGGSIATPGASCTIVVNVTGTATGSYMNTTGPVSSTNGGTGTTSNTANLNVALPPSITKAFSPTSIPVGATSTLTFTINNPNTNVRLTGIGFTDNLPGGLIAPNSGPVGACGVTGTLTVASNVITLSTGTIAQGGSCSFGVTVTGRTPGTQNNVTSNVTSNEGGTGNAANASVTVIAPPTISKSFGAPRIAVTGTAALSFTIGNPNTSTTLNGIAFSDTLPAGLVINTPNGLTGSCGGTITATQGTSVISMSGTSLAASSSCMFSVTVLGTAGGDQPNTTGNVTSTEGGTGTTASATINVIAPPTLSLAFNPTSIALNATTSLQFTITNPAVNTTALNGVTFTDNLPTGLTVASNGGVSQCGGTLTTTNPTTISLSGATVNQNSQCVFSVTVTGAAAGNFSNIVSGAGSITSTTNGIGATGPPSNTVNLTVVAPPTISKSFGAANITLNGTTSLTFTITNPAGNTTSENGIAFADTLSPGLQVASPNGLTNNCGGAATAVAGSTNISLSGGSIATPGATCTIVVNITGTATGIYTNTTGPISSTNGGTGATSNTAGLTVALPPSITKMFGAPGIAVTGSTSLSFTINNPNTNVPLTGIAFNDPLPAGLVVSTPNGQTGSCGAGTITAVAGSGSISLTAGTRPASGSCTFSVNVTGTVIGTQNNTTSAVASNEGGAGNMASASINVDAPGMNDIALTALTHAPDPVAVGGRLIFTATVTAKGPNTATVSLHEGFAGNLYVVPPAVPSQGSCSIVGASVDCNLGHMTGSVATPQVATVTVTVTPLLGSNITANGTVGSSITNPNPNIMNTDSGRVRIKARSRK